MEQPVSRRAWLSALVSGAGIAAAACGPSGPTEVTSENGPVLQWEGNDLLVLVSGYQKNYRAGDTISLNLIVNNQGTQLVEVKLLTKVLGLGDQPVLQAEAVNLTIDPGDAGTQDQQLLIPRDFMPGDYSLAVQVPSWKAGGRDTGPGTTLRTSIKVAPPA